MGLRGIAGEMARGTAGLWKGVADMVDPVERAGPARPSNTRADAASDDTIVADPVDPAASADGDGVEELPGRMVVPIDTWSRILEQVGHVHEAGQQLAEARERAARAETENRFLRDQLAELKKGRPRRRPAAPAVGDATGDDAAPLVSEPTTASSRLDRVRRRASGWLSP